MVETEILLIGIGLNHNRSGEIIKTENISEVETIYGKDSCFYKAAREMKRFGLEGFYVLNLDTWEEIKVHSDEFRDYEFDYIVPLDLLLDDMYHDEYYRKNLYYSQLLLLLLDKTSSVMIMTGKSSELYEDLDKFLEDELKRIRKAKIVYRNLRKENMLYVANNISGCLYANAVLAAIINGTDYADYPNTKGLGTAHFEIDYNDITDDMVYFKNNDLTGMTVENLVNFSSDKLEKLFTVNRILKYLSVHVPENQNIFIGKTYSEYRRMEIEHALIDYLEGLKGWIIYDYEFLGTTPTLEEDGTVTIHMKYDVWPKFTVERYRMEAVL